MKFTADDATRIEKQGLKMDKYFGKDTLEQADLKHVRVDEGHFEEFYHEKSAFIYYVLDGEGVFYLDGEETLVKPGDVLAIPPGTNIYYMGEMELLLVTAPAWEEEHEVHVRDIPRT